jgi:hypothetical protein
MPFLLLLLFVPALLLAPATASAADVELAWDPCDEPDLAGYKVYYGVASGTYLWSKDCSDVTCIITGLTIGTAYYFVVVAVDTYGYESEYSNEFLYTVSSQTSSIIVGGADGGGGGGGGGGCFIATAAFGSYLDPHVLVLRVFRDRFLLTNRLGRSFVAWYYRTSPPYADSLRNSDLLRPVVRVALLPLVGYAYCSTALGFLPTLLIFLTILTGIAAWTRKKLLASARARHFNSH